MRKKDVINATVRTPEGILQSDQEFVKIGTRGIASKSSWFYHLIEKLPLVYMRDGRWYYIPLLYRLLNQKKTDYETLIPIAIDQGNGFFKLAGQTLDHRLESIVLPSRIEVVEDQVLYGAKKRSIWRVGTMEAMKPLRVRLGDDAEGKKARGFAVGKTSERFEDPLYPMALKIAVVQLLKKLGHQPGKHCLAIGLALRIPEISIDENGQQHVDPDVTKAIRRDLKGTFIVEEIVGNTSEVWTITIPRIFPTTQTIGSYFLWNFNLLCEPAQSTFRTVRVLDAGTGDLGEAIARQRPGHPLVIEGHVINDGAIQFASAVSDAMRTNFPSTRFTVAKAQQAIIENELEIGGQAYPLILSEDLLIEEALRSSLEDEEDIDEQQMIAPRAIESIKRDASYNLNVELKVNNVRRSYKDAIEQLLVDSNPYLQDQSAFLIVTGGTLKNPLYANKLERRIGTLNRTFSDSLTMPLDDDFSIKANALGTYVFTCWQINRLIQEQHVV
jgi:hypothetical protein